MGLTISHLSWRNLGWSDLDIAGYGSRWPRSERHSWRRRWRLAFQQLGYADGKKQHGPGTVPARTVHVLDKRKKSHGDQDNWADKAVSAANPGIRTKPGTNVA